MCWRAARRKHVGWLTAKRIDTRCKMYMYRCEIKSFDLDIYSGLRAIFMFLHMRMESFGICRGLGTLSVDTSSPG